MKKEEKTKKSREKIIAAAIELFGKKGYDNFTVSTLCKEYNISKGLLYHNFSGKRDLFVHCVEESYSQLLKVLQNGSEVPSFPEYVQIRLQFFKQNPLLSRIFFESLIKADQNVYEEIKVIRQKLLDFNKQVYLNFLSKEKLRDGISEQDAIEYFELIQKMINSYYNSPIASTKGSEFFIKQHEKKLGKFLDFILFGVANTEKV